MAEDGGYPLPHAVFIPWLCLCELKYSQLISVLRDSHKRNSILNKIGFDNNSFNLEEILTILSILFN